MLLTGPPRREKDDAIDLAHHNAENCVFALRNMAIGNRITEISREANHAEQTGDNERFNQLTYEQLELEKIRRELQRKIVRIVIYFPFLNHCGRLKHFMRPSIVIKYIANNYLPRTLIKSLY